MQRQYVEDPDFYTSYYLNQAGNGMPIYGGVRIQRGYGLGGFFASLFRSSLPFLKHGARVIGKEALRTGLGVASDVLEGQNWKESAKSRFGPAVGRVLQRMQTGSGIAKRKCALLGLRSVGRGNTKPARTVIKRGKRTSTSIKRGLPPKRARRVLAVSDIFD